MDGAMDTLATIILVVLALMILIPLLVALWPLVAIGGALMLISSADFASWEWLGQWIVGGLIVLFVIGCILELLEKKQ